MIDRKDPQIGAVLLAGGSSSRLGRPKQLIKFGGMSLLRRAASAATGAKCSPVIVVTGASAEECSSELDGLDVHEVVNSKWSTGMASSIRAGIRALTTAAPQTSAAVILLCDQPHVSPEIIENLLEKYRSTNAPVVASSYGKDGYGVPALFERSLFPELLELEGDIGAKRVITKWHSAARFLPFPQGEVDIDTPEDVANLGSAALPQ
jgi:molybdenum cofactor cytidylyltransferase